MKDRALYIFMFGATMAALVGVAHLQNEGNKVATEARDRIIKIEKETIPCLADERCRKVLKSVVARNEDKPVSEVQLPSLKEAEDEIQRETETVAPDDPRNLEPGIGGDGDGMGSPGKEKGRGDKGGGDDSPASDGGGGPAPVQPSPGSSDEAPGNSGGSDPDNGNGDEGNQEGSGRSSGVTILPESDILCVEVPETEVPKMIETNPLQVGC